ncbi:MAG: hypothetical protein Q4C80_02870 [Bacillota bacterium]|nr:hypothetical protein [Bacillota bacterium]
MAKKQHIPRSAQMYNRQTKGYQRNVMKNMPDLEMPKMINRKKLIAMNIAVGVVTLALIIILFKFVNPWVGFIPVLLSLVYLLGVMRYMNGKQKEIILYYQKMGMTKKRFLQQVNMQSKSQKKKSRESNMKFYNRMWDVAASDGKAKLTFFEKLMGY